MTVCQIFYKVKIIYMTYCQKFKMGDNPFGNVSDDIELPEFTHKEQSASVQPMKPNVVANVTEIPKFDPSTLPLDKKARLEVLKAREAELLQKQRQLQATASTFTNAPNWPSFFPLIHYDPENDLPQGSRHTIKLAVYLLISYNIFVIFNLFSVLSVRMSDYKHLSNFTFACIEGIAGAYVILNYIYAVLYSSCQKRDIPFRWTIYMFCFIGWLAYLAVGFPTSGSVGLATFLDVLSKSSSGFSKFMAFVNSFIAICSVVIAFLLLGAAQAYQKISGNDEPIRGDQAVEI